MKSPGFYSSYLLQPTVLAAAMIVMLSPFTAQAAPTLEGMNIVMPEDGWYQVQDRSDYSEVCAGVYNCEVPAGSYNVINHSTGERFRIEVGNVELENNAVQVVGNVISWSGQEGWFQVQNADTYESVCEGGTSCIVEAGRYKVINHSTGERFDDIVVSTEVPPVSPEVTSTAVGDLRFVRYSSSAIELFWSHVPSYDSQNGYNIYQDGRSIGRTQGTSFFIRDLPDDSSYEFDVRQAGQSSGSVITVPADGDVIDPPAVIDPPIVEVETALELASRIDVPRYEKLIADVTAVTTAGEYTADNYTKAISAIAVTSESRIPFERTDFLALLERQVMNNDSTLGFTQVSVSGLNSRGQYTRQHNCTDGGSYFATKYETADIPGLVILRSDIVGDGYWGDLSGEYNFENCQIGEILIDGFYSSEYQISDTGIDAFLRFGIEITGVDGAVTTLTSALTHRMAVADEGTIEATYQGSTSVGTIVSVAVPSGGEVNMEVAADSSERALLNGAAIADAIPADSYSVAITRAYVGVVGSGVEIWGLSSPLLRDATSQSSEDGETYFSQGRVEYVFSPRGNSMMIDANNGDPSSFNAFISSSPNTFSADDEHTVVSYVVPWASGEFNHGSLGQRMLPIWSTVSE